MNKIKILKKKSKKVMVLVSGIFGVSQWNFGARTVHPILRHGIFRILLTSLIKI